MKKFFGILLVVCIGWQIYLNTRKVSYGPGILVLQAPVQQPLDPPPVLSFGEVTLKELATFDLKAKVLAKKNYRFGPEAELSPTDLALGWGLMSDEQVLKDIKISQSGRFYYWRTREFPIPRKDIEQLSANMHLIPFNDDVAKEIKRVREGEIIRLSGTLVEVKGEGGWVWKSSLSRKDTGKGACEVVLVKEVEAVEIVRAE